MTFTYTLFCIIDTSRVEEMDRIKVEAGTVRMAVVKEMRTKGKDDRCKAVTVDAKVANRIKIVCRDEIEQCMIKQPAKRWNRRAERACCEATVAKVS